MRVSSSFVVPAGSPLPGIPDVVTNLNVSHDLVAVANSHGDIYILNGQCQYRTSLRAHDTLIWSLASSPDGHILASGGRDGLVKIWDTVTSSVISFFLDSPGRLTVGVVLAYTLYQRTRRRFETLLSKTQTLSFHPVMQLTQTFQLESGMSRLVLVHRLWSVMARLF